jgi:hypothetical protein
VVGPALRAGRAQGVCKIRDREAILASSVASLRMSCSRPAAERGPYLLFPALAYMLTLFGRRLFTVEERTRTGAGSQSIGHESVDEIGLQLHALRVGEGCFIEKYITDLSIKG